MIMDVISKIIFQFYPRFTAKTMERNRSLVEFTFNSILDLQAIQAGQDMRKPIRVPPFNSILDLLLPTTVTTIHDQK